MKSISVRNVFYSALLAVFAGGAGCAEESAVTIQPPPPPLVALTGPEASFEAVVETFRRGVEDVPIGFVVHDDAGGHSMLTGRNEVTHQLVPPTKEDDRYHGTITVKSQARYSMQRSTEETNDQADEQSGDENANGQQSGDESGVEIFDPALVSAPDEPIKDRRPANRDKNAAIVARKETKHERSYQLVYENGRWKLITKLDPKTEKSIQYAFDQALKSQS